MENEHGNKLPPQATDIFKTEPIIKLITPEMEKKFDADHLHLMCQNGIIIYPKIIR